MKIIYKLNPKFEGKAHHDKDGAVMLHSGLSQRVLKELFKKGNKFVYETTKD